MTAGHARQSCLRIGFPRLTCAHLCGSPSLAPPHPHPGFRCWGWPLIGFSQCRMTQPSPPDCDAVLPTAQRPHMPSKSSGSNNTQNGQEPPPGSCLPQHSESHRSSERPEIHVVVFCLTLILCLQNLQWCGCQAPPSGASKSTQGKHVGV